MDAESLFGDIALVWGWPSFIMAALTGFSFGYFVVASIVTQEKWRTKNPRLVYAWLIFVLAFGALLWLDFGQTFGALLEKDRSWPRVLSRLGQHVAFAVFLGVGVFAGMGRHADGGLPERFYEWWANRRGERRGEGHDQ
jgi:hypothetical protein